MGSYFKRLRRKIGVVTLVMACVFAAGWVRSLVTKDTFSLRRDPRTICFVILNQSRVLLWQLTAPFATTTVQGFHETAPVANENYFNETEYVVEWHWQAAWFEFGKTHYRNFTPKFENQFFFIPYWSIVVPLTLLSGWLLLSKPRVSQTKKPAITD